MKGRIAGLIFLVWWLQGCGSPPDLSEFDLERGEKVYKNRCIACHLAGMPGNAPKVGRSQQWRPRIEKGLTVLFRHSLEGFNAMPPKGGDENLSEGEIKDAVAFMVSQSW